jgi:cytochrome oxidase Cu insertion factor (SCO1/SenC/PrrC family)
MSASEALRQYFAGRDVVFVYISINDSKEKWQRLLASHQFDTFQAVQLWSPDLKTAQAYLMREYPSYYLIGRNGQFLSIRAPQPSNNKEVVAAIEQALLR